MIFSLHKVKSDADGFMHLSMLAEATQDISDEKLRLDFSRCTHFDANMAAPLAAILNHATNNHNYIEIVNPKRQIEEILRKNRFLRNYGYPPLEDVNHTTLPFVHLANSDTKSFASYLSLHMNGKGIPQMSDRLEKEFRRSIFEVFQNCVSHSGSERGVFVCGQFYPYQGRLDLTISDIGVGIPTNVRRHLRNDKMLPTDAIKWALMEGNTTKTGEQPGGMGLKLLKDFIEFNGGRIIIASRQGLYQLVGKKEVYKKLISDFPGTTINLEINTKDTHRYRLRSEVTPENLF